MAGSKKPPPIEGELVSPADRTKAALKQADLRADDRLGDYQESLDLQAASVQAQASFSGPIPSPRMLTEYDLAVPGLAKRLIAAGEKQGDHRRAMEMMEAKTDRFVATCGVVLQFFGAVSAWTIGLAGFWAAYKVAALGHPWTAAVIAGLDIGGLAAAFIAGSKRKKKAAVSGDE